MTIKGREILKNPRLNKGTAFTLEEREALDLLGILPPVVSTMEQQLDRALANLRRQPSDIEKYVYLSSLQKRNERLFYRLLMEHTHELMPLVYTPTVGQACEEFAAIFRETAGFYVTTADKGRIADVLANWPEKDVRLIVVTDGERILGLGDLGANGMGIPIGKLALYCACAGLHPEQCMPILLDTGTENQEYLKDPLYLGQRQQRVRGEEYADFIDEFIEAVKLRFPNALLQFEDFATPNAVALLAKYRDELLCFNDDIQGTAAVVVAGLIASAKLTNVALKDQTYLFLGAGSASTGIGALLIKTLQTHGLTEEEARARLYYVDREGLVISSHSENYGSHVQPFVKDLPSMTFLEALKRVKPGVLIGATGTAGIFTREVIELMAEYNESPVIFALSNPTSKAECTAEEAYRWTEGRAVFASGSPFGVVHINGEIKVPGQGNNAYIFPGLGLGALFGNVTRISDAMLIQSAETLADSVTDKEIAQGCLYPPLSDIREVSLRIAVDVAKEAERAGLVSEPVREDLEDHIRSSMYYPEY